MSGLYSPSDTLAALSNSPGRDRLMANNRTGFTPSSRESVVSVSRSEVDDRSSTVGSREIRDLIEDAKSMHSSAFAAFRYLRFDRKTRTVTETAPAPSHRSKSFAQENFRFYNNESKAMPDGVSIEDILKKWKGRKVQLETHSFIQWLFPLFEQGANYFAQPLSAEEVEKMKASAEIQSRMLAAYDMMLDHWGFQRATDQVTVIPSSQSKERLRSLDDSCHNFNRITRVLLCLRIFNFRQHQICFIVALIRQILHGFLRSTLDSLWSFWIPTIDNDNDRNSLYDFLVSCQLRAQERTASLDLQAALDMPATTKMARRSIKDINEDDDIIAEAHDVPSSSTTTTTTKATRLPAATTGTSASLSVKKINFATKSAFSDDDDDDYQSEVLLKTSSLSQQQQQQHQQHQPRPSLDRFDDIKINDDEDNQALLPSTSSTINTTRALLEPSRYVSSRHHHQQQQQQQQQHRRLLQLQQHSTPVDDVPAGDDADDDDDEVDVDDYTIRLASVPISEFLPKDLIMLCRQFQVSNLFTSIKLFDVDGAAIAFCQSPSEIYATLQLNSLQFYLECVRLFVAVRSVRKFQSTTTATTPPPSTEATTSSTSTSTSTTQSYFGSTWSVQQVVTWANGINIVTAENISKRIEEFRIDGAMMIILDPVLTSECFHCSANTMMKLQRAFKAIKQ